MSRKQVMMAISCMRGGGAERVASLLINEMNRQGFDTSFLLTNSSQDEVVRCDLNEKTPLLLLQEQLAPQSMLRKVGLAIVSIYSRVMCGVFEKREKAVPSHLAYLSFLWQHDREIQALRKMMLEKPGMTVIAFLQPTIPMVLLAARGLPNRIMISERGDPKRLMKNRYGERFLRKYGTRADRIVFQTPDAKNTYPENLRDRGTVIFNPLKSDLPAPYIGERDKIIVTFCRITAQKNLPLLIDAFARFLGDFPDYRLHIIGDTQNAADADLKKALEKQIQTLAIEYAVEFLPFSANVHQDILRDAMYVNSSDYEGMSNGMLEAMAIGLPVICTDCPIGGARAIIRDHENGILVPIRDPDAMYQAMKEIVENPALAEKIGQNAAKLREELNSAKIAEQWIDLLTES